MNSPYRTHPALPLPQRDNNTIPFPVPPPAKPAVANKLEILVALEGDIRKQPKRSALAYHAVNETRGLVAFDQAFLFRSNRNNKLVMDLASSISRIEAQSSLVRSITKSVQTIADNKKPALITLALAKSQDDYPLKHGFWSPFLDAKGKCFGGLLFARQLEFTESDGMIASRLGQTYAHAFRALTPPSLLRLISIPSWLMVLAPLLLLGLFFIPVPMTSLAPFEVIAKNPFIITAPIDGAISEVIAEPNSMVKKGDVVFKFDATVLRANAEIAQQKAMVAQSKLDTAKNGAFNDLDMKRSLAELQSEVQLAEAERDYASELFARTTVRATADGLLIYSNRNDLVGKPVRVGEKIMELASPEYIEYRADLNVHDSISLQSGAKVKLFLDADPLHPRSGSITETSYHATEKAGGILAYTLRVAPEGNAPPVRIGLRGTAQLSGAQVSLGFYLLRRPIAALRQYFGM
jgi:multidrug resistance efflux pump